MVAEIVAAVVAALVALMAVTVVMAGGDSGGGDGGDEICASVGLRGLVCLHGCMLCACVCVYTE